MARIRSVHPGLFTDEAFMAASPYARLLAIGLWTECWDDGVFEWKPLTLKARIFPVDNIDVEALLAELASLNVIREFSAGGRKHGAVRNFTLFQRPKKPNSSGLLPAAFRTYVGLTDTSSEPEGAQAQPVPNSRPLNEGEFGKVIADGEEEEDGGEDGGRKKDSDVDDDDSSVPRARKRRKTADYAFAARHIRLTAADLEAWRKAFPRLDLEAELWGLDAWAGGQKSWFKAVSGALAKKNREAAERIRARQAEVESRNATARPDWDPRL